MTLNSNQALVDAAYTTINTFVCAGAVTANDSPNVIIIKDGSGDEPYVRIDLQGTSNVAMAQTIAKAAVMDFNVEMSRKAVAGSFGTQYVQYPRQTYNTDFHTSYTDMPGVKQNVVLNAIDTVDRTQTDPNLQAGATETETKIITDATSSGPEDATPPP